MTTGYPAARYVDSEGTRLEPVAGPVRIAGFTRLPRIAAIPLIRDAIGSCGGFILDSHMYSNAMLAVNFELRASRLGSLVEVLSREGFSMGCDSVSYASDHDSWAGSDLVVAGSLSVNFIHDDPPLRIEVPAVPG